MSEPPQTAQRRVSVKREAQLPYIAMAHHTPNWRDKDAPALAMLESILGGGETSRLHQRLVRKEAIALSTGAVVAVSSPVCGAAEAGLGGRQRRADRAADSAQRLLDLVFRGWPNGRDRRSADGLGAPIRTVVAGA